MRPLSLPGIILVIFCSASAPAEIQEEDGMISPLIKANELYLKESCLLFDGLVKSRLTGENRCPVFS